jgi:hypothetical protein
VDAGVQAASVDRAMRAARASRRAVSFMADRTASRHRRIAGASA